MQLKESQAVLEDEADDLEAELKKAARRSDNARASELKSQIETARRASLPLKRQLAAESGRLLKLALDHFPELLRPNGALALAVFTDSVKADDRELLCSGLLDLARSMVRTDLAACLAAYLRALTCVRAGRLRGTEDTVGSEC